MSQFVSEKWQKWSKSYTDYLINHVQVASWTESWMKTLSYLVAGKISKSHANIVAELMYSTSNLMTLFHDYLLRKHHNLHKPEEAAARPIKLMLSALEAIEVFVEISAKSFGNSHIRWILVFSLEVLKTIGRFVLLHKYKIGLRTFPLIKRLDRKSMTADGEEETEEPAETETFYTLEGSGRKIRSVSAKYRSTVAPAESAVSVELTEEQRYAESLHNLQPLIYLSTAWLFGERSWYPWIASLATDLSSLAVLKQERYQYKKREQAELLRRRFMLLMYLLRSPCYDSYTRTKLVRMLTVLSRIPLAGRVMSSLKEYLPEWQGTYFYTWSS